MRKLIIMRGAQGSGKSHMLRSLGIQDFSLSMDQLRLALHGPVLNVNGRFGISQAENTRVFEMFHNILDARMREGELVAIDATFPKVGTLNRALKLAQEHRYQVLCVDLFNKPIELVRAGNLSRPELLRVSDFVIDRTIEAVQALPGSVPTVGWSADDAHLDAVRAFLSVPVRDLSEYERIVHVGDLQGCFEVMKTSILAEGFRDDTFYVFVGDLLDRGIENGQVLAWAKRHLVGFPNRCLLGGNHETHIERWVDGKASLSKEFSLRTQPQIEEAGIRPGQMAPLCASLLDVLPYTWRGTRVLVTHAGLPCWPTDLAHVATHHFRDGPGTYDTAVDVAFTEWAEAQGQDVYQVHGHRNPDMLPVQAAPRSFNLEGQVEFGGHLRTVVLDAHGFHPEAVRNTVYRPAQEWVMINTAENRAPQRNAMPIAPWMQKAPATTIDLGRLQSLRDHAMVRESASEAYPHISAFNFSKDAFFGKNWDSITTHTRGLFINTTTREIVARSYEKFFNIDEPGIPQTAMPHLLETLTFPVTGYLKENGFLGITGYDAQTGSLLVASKSRLDGTFAEIFQEILTAQIGEAGMERLMRLLRDQDASATFEVIDPVRDPHMIAYEHPEVVLLDIIHRSEVFETMPYKDLCRVADILGVRVKQRMFELPNKHAFERFVKGPLADMNWRFHGQPVEGVVFEDATGVQTKGKGAYYSFWKQMRGVKDRIRATMGTQQALNRKVEGPLAEAFVAFARRQPADVLDRDIITLRTAFEADPEQTLVGNLPPPVAPEVQKHLRACAAFAEQVRGGRVPAAAVRKFLDRLPAGLENTPDYATLVAAAG